MQYRTDRQIVQDLVPIMLFTVVMWDGADHETDDTKTLIALLQQAENEAVAGVDDRSKQKLLRRARRVRDEIVEPFREEEAAVAKFGLVIFYALDKLRAQGLFHVVEGSAFDTALTAILGNDGTLVEFANIEKVDRSAQKRARKVFSQLQESGLFQGAEWF